jgi:membrane-bound inhibitor of C-type lysozyme
VKRVLLDENMPHKPRMTLYEFETTTVRYMCRIAVVSLSARSWALVEPQVGKIIFAAANALSGSFTRFDSGTFSRRRPRFD